MPKLQILGTHTHTYCRKKPKMISLTTHILIKRCILHNRVLLETKEKNQRFDYTILTGNIKQNTQIYSHQPSSYKKTLSSLTWSNKNENVLFYAIWLNIHTITHTFEQRNLLQHNVYFLESHKHRRAPDVPSMITVLK